MDKTKIAAIMQDPEKCKKLAEEFIEQFESDNEAPRKMGYYLLKAYLEGNVDDALIALCGWSLKSLLERSGAVDSIPDEPVAPAIPVANVNENIVYLYTDGACQGNPGPGGWGAIIKDGSDVKELSGGEEYTTNNRMELMGAIKGLEAIEKPSRVILTSDSKYLVDSVTKDWVYGWEKLDWIRKGEIVPNTDLWKRLLVQLRQHKVEFRWVKGHAGHPENERCDKLAVAQCKKCKK